jgi:acyl-CoA oxidase
MTYLLDGGAEVTKVREEIMREIEAQPELQPYCAADVSRDAVREITLRRVRAAYRLFMADGGDLTRRAARLELLGLVDSAWVVRQGVHFGLAGGALQSQADSDQIAEWLPYLFGLRGFFCFGMTELGHGSHVRGIETRAVFKPGDGADGDGQFDVHTPSVTATKWWIGGAAHTATHCTVYARLCRALSSATAAPSRAATALTMAGCSSRTCACRGATCS